MFIPSWMKTRSQLLAQQLAQGLKIMHGEGDRAQRHEAKGVSLGSALCHC